MTFLYYSVISTLNTEQPYQLSQRDRWETNRLTVSLLCSMGGSLSLCVSAVLCVWKMGTIPAS